MMDKIKGIPIKKSILILLAIMLVASFGIHKVLANHYTPWTIVSVTTPDCEYKNIPNMGNRGYLVQYIVYKRTVMDGRTGQTHVEYKSERKVMGQGGGAGCPMK